MCEIWPEVARLEQFLFPMRKTQVREDVAATLLARDCRGLSCHVRAALACGADRCPSLPAGALVRLRARARTQPGPGESASDASGRSEKSIFRRTTVGRSFSAARPPCADDADRLAMCCLPVCEGHEQDPVKDRATKAEKPSLVCRVSNVRGSAPRSRNAVSSHETPCLARFAAHPNKASSSENFPVANLKSVGAIWRDPLDYRMRERRARMCAGVVPQHPPIICTPAASSSGAPAATSSGVSGYTVAPLLVMGRPALA